MEIKLIKESKNVFEALGLTPKRIDEIIDKARDQMSIKNEASGLSLLQHLINETVNTEEVIAMTLVWDDMYKKAEQMKMAQAMKQKMNEDGQKLKIVKR